MTHDRALPASCDPAWLMTDVRTFAEGASRTSMLTVACLRCERRGRYRLDTLIARHVADAGVRKWFGPFGNRIAS